MIPTEQWYHAKRQEPLSLRFFVQVAQSSDLILSSSSNSLTDRMKVVLKKVRTWPRGGQESNNWQSDSWHQINDINPKTGVATFPKEKNPWHQNPPNNNPVLRSWWLSWFTAAKDTCSNAAGTGKRLMLPQRRDIFKTLRSYATILISLMMEQPKNSWTSIPKRA